MKRCGRFNGDSRRPGVQFYVHSLTKLERVRDTDELVELWYDKYEIQEEVYVEVVKFGCDDAGGSKYSLTPLNSKYVKAGRVTRVNDGTVI